MAWEMQSSNSRNFQSGVAKYGAAWAERPMVAILKNGLQCNKAFAEIFGYKPKEAVNVFFDKTRLKIGFQRPATTAASDAAYRMAPAYKGGLLITCTRAPKNFPKHVGKAFPATLNNSDKIIEVQLS